MSQPLRSKGQQEHPTVSTILPGHVMVPICCDHCGRETDVSLQQLKAQHPILCEHCYTVRTFSDTELRLTRMLLADAGFHFA